MKLNNPCSMAELLTYSSSIPFVDDNKIINLLYIELNKISSKVIEKRNIAAIFKLLQYYHPQKYIDIGCMALAIISQSDIQHLILLNIKKGDFGIIEGVDLNIDNTKINDISNNLKQIIAETFCFTLK